MNGPDELRNTLFMFWEAQKYTSCKVLNDQNLWPPMEIYKKMHFIHENTTVS